MKFDFLIKALGNVGTEFLEKILIQILKMLAKRTDSNVDDDFVTFLEAALGTKEVSNEQ